MDAKHCTELNERLAWLREDIIGRHIHIGTPFGEKPLVYADYTASGRGLKSVERYMQHILQYYANTHTEDDFTGKTMTQLLHEAERVIKRCVNAGDKGKIIFTESGTTGGITKLMAILGVYWPPATRERVNAILRSCLIRNPEGQECNAALFGYMHRSKPIVFVGPYEHHSNEIMWRQTLCEIVEIPLGKDQEFDLEALERIVSDPAYSDRLKIGSFSAASNVTGLKTPVYDVARILHRHKALACFDFAACAPYVQIDMNRDEQSYFDAIFLSPHKFLGGPGTSGILVFNRDIYPADLPPTVSAGGTVDYVSPMKEEYVRDIEGREKPGTPGIMQALRIALAFQLKEKVGLDTIDTLEKHFYERFMNKLQDHPGIMFYGPQATAKKVPIVPFNIIFKDKVLHPKFVTRLLNDLFGIQSRAGCSCAGPYGHYLMHIPQKVSDYYRCLITNAGYTGIKPGWVRLNLHYSMTTAEVDYLAEAVKFVAEHGHKFLSRYEFNIKTGEWAYMGFDPEPPLKLDINAALASGPLTETGEEEMGSQYALALAAAKEQAANLENKPELLKFEPELEALMYFPVVLIKGLS